MFRVVSEFIDRPLFMMICDNRSCKQIVHREIEQDDWIDSAKMQTAQAGFITAAAKEGWRIGLDSQLCPLHTERAMANIRARQEEREEQGKLIVPVASMEVVNKWDGKLSRIK